MMILTSLGDLLWGLRRRRIVRAITQRQVVLVSPQLSTHIPNKQGKPRRLLMFDRCLYMNENSRVLVYVYLYCRKVLTRASQRCFEHNRKGHYLFNEVQRVRCAQYTQSVSI